MLPDWAGLGACRGGSGVGPAPSVCACATTASYIGRPRLTPALDSGRLRCRRRVGRERGHHVHDDQQRQRVDWGRRPCRPRRLLQRLAGLRQPPLSELQLAVPREPRQPVAQPRRAHRAVQRPPPRRLVPHGLQAGAGDHLLMAGQGLGPSARCEDMCQRRGALADCGDGGRAGRGALASAGVTPRRLGAVARWAP